MGLQRLYLEFLLTGNLHLEYVTFMGKERYIIFNIIAAVKKHENIITPSSDRDTP